MKKNMSREELLQLVVDFQIKKIISLFPDFLEKKEYQGLPDYFRYHLYAPANKEERDKALRRLKERIEHIASKKLIRNLDRLIELSDLTDSLDLDTAKELEKLLQNGASLNEKTIEEAIRRADRIEDRKKQVEMIVELLRFFHSLARFPFLKIMLGPIKVAAYVVGAERLIQTMEEGYKIAIQIKDIQPFLKAFEERQKKYLREIFQEDIF